jgi:alpha-mannosidase
MLRYLFFAAMILAATVPAVSQFRALVDRNAGLLKVLGEYSEGYSQTLGGETLQYPRLTQAFPVALLTRATTGAMAIEWKAGRVQTSPASRQADFVVRAGMYGQEEAGREFRMFVNDIPRFTFATTTAESWSVKGEAGGVATFDGVLRDQFRDWFGYLRVSVPVEWLEGGNPPRLKIVGEKAGSPAWFMVFQDPEVITSLREKVKVEAWCEMQVVPANSRYAVTVTASSNWAGRRLTWISGRREGIVVPLLQQDGHAGATLTADVGKADPIRILLDNEPIAELKGMIGGAEETRIFPGKLVTLRTRTAPGATWILEYQSTFMPELGGSLIQLSDAGRGTGDLRLIISSHQDIAWMDSPAQCIKDRDEKVITPALALLREDPEYRFDVEDVLELREFLERHPDRKAEIHRFASVGRLGIGASYTMPYEDLCSGEMLVRQFYAGRRWFIKNFPGCDTRTVWNPDVPGRSAQSLQIMQKAGVQNLVISRHEKGLYDWRSPDGSGVLVFSPHHYGLFSERTAGKPLPEATAYLASFARDWRGGITNGSSNVPVLVMSDMSVPAKFDDFIKTWNGLTSITVEGGKMQELSLPRLRYSTAEEFFADVRRENRTLPVLNGERPNLWLYIHGPTHHRAISAKREADIFLPSAEIFSTIDALLSQSFSRYPYAKLTEAWESQIYPDHGWGGKNGEVTDSVFRAKYEHAREVAMTLHARATRSIAARVRTPEEKGIPLVVFNGLSWKRTGIVHTTVALPQGALAKGFTFHDATGTKVPLQVLALERHRDRSVKSAEIIFPATDIPSIGYVTYYLKPSNNVLRVSATKESAPPVLENPFYRVRLGAGGVEQIRDKDLGVDLLKGGKFLGGELFTMQSVGEDAGEWAEPQQPTMEGFDKLSNHRPHWRLIESGPVRQVVEVQQPIDHVTVVQRVVLYRGLKQIDFETSLLDWDGTKYREFRLAFPIDMQDARVTYEVPFAALEVGKDEIEGAAGERYSQKVSAVRPRSIQRWISVSDTRVGVTLSSSVAVWDYRDPTDSPLASPLLQPVLLASRRSCHGEGNWYLQKGDHHYRFSLTSHSPGWRNGRRFGCEADAPLTAVLDPQRSAPGNLPEQMSFFSVDAGNVALSTLKKAEEGDQVIVRLVEEEGRPASATMKFFRPIQRAESTDILEEGGTPLPAKDGSVEVMLGHHAITTIRLVQ